MKECEKLVRRNTARQSNAKCGCQISMKACQNKQEILNF